MAERDASAMQEDTGTRARWRIWLYMALVVMLGSYTMLTDLNRGALSGDEAKYAGVTDNIVDKGHWLHLIRPDGEPYFSKPPLGFLLVASTRDLFADGPFRYRIWSSVLALVSVVLTLVLGARLFNPEVGFLSATMLAVHPGWMFRYAHWFSLDTLLVVNAMVVYLGAWKAINGRVVPGWTMVGLAAAALSLTKPLMGIPYVLGMMVIVPFLSEPDQRRKNALLGLGALAMCIALIAPWNAAQYLEYGEAFWTKGPGFDLVDRVYVGLKQHTQPWWYYGPAITTSFLPFFLAGPSLLFGAVMVFRNQRRSAWKFLLAVTLLVLAAISSSTSKVPYYAFPIFPMLAIAISAMVLNVVEWIGRWMSPRINLAVKAALLAIAFAAAIASARHTLSNDFERKTAVHNYLPWFLYQVAGRSTLSGLKFYSLSYPHHTNVNWGRVYYYDRMRPDMKPISTLDLAGLVRSSEPAVVIFPRIDELRGTALRLRLSGFAVYITRSEIAAVRGLDLGDYPWIEHVRRD